MSARRRVSRRNVSGRTHRSAPTRGGERSEVNGNWYETTPCPAGRGGARPLQGERSRRVCPGRRGVVTPPYGSNTGGAQRRADVGIGPYEKESKPHQPPGPAAHSGAYAARSRGMSGNWSRDHSQRDHQRRTIPQSRLRLTAPFAQGSLGDVGIRPFYDGRGFGPPRSSAPAESPIDHPSQPARSGASAPAAARDGRESTQEPSQKGDRPPATAWAALSEAESTERAAGQIQVLPDD